MSFKPTRAADVQAVVPQVTISSEKFLPTVVEEGEIPLPKEAAQMIPKLVAELTGKKSVIDFGEGATVRVSQFADKMLDHVSMMNIGEFQKPLTDILVLCNSVNSQSIISGKLNSRIPFLNRLTMMFSSVKTRALSNINSVRGQIEDITKELVKREGDLHKNIDIMEEMYLLNMQEYYSLMAHIKAVEQVMVLKKAELDQFQRQNEGSKDPIVGLEVSNRTDFLTALDKKLYDLRAISLLCLDTAPMIRNEQRSSKNSIDKFRSIRSMAIPAWKKQAALMISSLENSRAASLGKKISDTTNQMVKDNADAVSKNTIDTARLGERGVLDLDTMEHVNKVLIDTVNETMKIGEDGSKYRSTAGIRMEELKQSLNLNVVRKGAA